MARVHFRPPTESTSLNQSPKIFKGDYIHNHYRNTKFGADLFMGGEICEQMEQKLLLFIYTPCENSATGQTGL